MPRERLPSLPLDRREHDTPLAPGKIPGPAPIPLAPGMTEAEKAIVRHSNQIGLAFSELAGAVLASRATTGELVQAVQRLAARIEGLLAAADDARARGQAIAVTPSLPPPPVEINFGEIPTNHGLHANVKLDVLESIRAQFQVMDAEKRGALEAVRILQDEKAEHEARKVEELAKARKDTRELYTTIGIIAVPVIMVLEHFVWK
jgi:hypothetical protein